MLVDGRAGELPVEVAHNAALAAAALAGAGTGTRLSGLRERVSAAGGSFDAEPTPGGGWAVSARLARRTAAPA